MLHPTLTALLETEPEGYGDWALQEEITRAVHRIRDEHRNPPYGIRITNRSESERLRDYFDLLLRPYGLRVQRAPNWRGREYT
jgi:hypothetical protein